MKLVHRDLVRNGPGSIKLLPEEEEEDLRHAYHLIAAGDTLQAVTVRNSDIATRQKYVSLVESVKLGGTVHMFSSMHVSGDQLAQLTVIAAILRFPLPDFEDIEM